MVQCPDALVWELVKNNSSFMKKVNGKSRRSGTVRFSVEKGNLRNISSFRNSGLANSKAVDISATAGNGAALSTKTASKAHSHPKKGQATAPLNKNYSRVQNTIKSQTCDIFYRRDLESDALARYSAVYRGNRAAKGVKKGVPVKKGRA